MICYIVGMGCISTHSLTRRLTASDDDILPFWKISTHSLTRRLTTAADEVIIAVNPFQLTASQGG